jgi:hypothetical protein
MRELYYSWYSCDAPVADADAAEIDHHGFFPEIGSFTGCKN